MKNLLFLFVMLAFLVACSDDDKSPKNKYGQFLIEKIVCPERNGVLEFAYNSKNELTQMTITFNDFVELYTWEREGSNITMTYREGVDDDGVQICSTLDENENVVFQQDGVVFTYDASNRLVSMDADNESEQYVWKGNNMQSVKDKYGDEYIVFEYTKYSNNFNLDFLYWLGEIFVYRIGVGAGYFGQPNQNLMKSYTFGGYRTYEFEYEFDGEKVSVVREYYVRDGERELYYTYRLYYK